METADSNTQKYRALLDLSKTMVVHRDVAQLLRALASHLSQVVRFDRLALMLYDAEKHVMRVEAMESDGVRDVPRGTEWPVDTSIGGWVWQNQAPCVITDSATESRFPDALRIMRELSIRSFCVLPVTTPQQRYGSICFAHALPSAYLEADMEFLQMVANQVAMSYENALAFQRIRELRDKLMQEKLYLEDEIRTQLNFDEIVGSCSALKPILQTVATVAKTDSTVLIGGETGTGKELIARAIHRASHRSQRIFVKLNCAAIPSGLLESELFGHEKGSFTGAVSQRIGRFELAHQGTLFLDEVGDIPLELQPKLLRVLQELEFERLGSARTIRVNVRLVAATHRDLREMVRQGTFRSDLYYRLNVFPIQLPPLRERREDIPALARHFAEKHSRRMGKLIAAIPPAVVKALTEYDWPGNIRELENFMERAVILSSEKIFEAPITEVSAPAEAARPVPGVQRSAKTVADSDPAAQGVTLQDAERQHILKVLAETQWRIAGRSGAAARLGVKRTSLHSKMKKLGISRTQDDAISSD